VVFIIIPVEFRAVTENDEKRVGLAVSFVFCVNSVNMI
jgi:hypothetical protein